ncbi:PAS domain-containing sensor histidine kinase [Clostridium sp.]|uniref:sensor histidine kinase n=1 Tax=Clostridium sp. TaxID=1506 RepID=UPI0025871B5E|nr:PAS domain-containing sensor histidine kinase [Clostridium sp.]MDF2504468.1 signal transduction histidine kinase [Clostridium sp.]
MKYTLKTSKKPFFCIKDNVINTVNKDFIDFSGYLEKELMGRSLNEISRLLRIDTVVNLKDIEDKFQGYVFTKDYNAREVTIVCKHLEANNERRYYFREKPNSRIEDKMMFVTQICKNEKVGTAIWSFPDFVMLNCNNKFLKDFYQPYTQKEKCIGKYKREIVTGCEDNNIDEIWSTIKNTGESYHANELKHEDKVNGTSYWNLSLVPIYVDGNIKYIVENKWDITEKILGIELRDKQSKIIENQKKQLEAIIENMSDPLFIFDKSGKYININKAAREKASICKKLKNMGDSLKEVKYLSMDRKLIPKEKLPISRVLKGEKISGYKFIINYYNKFIYCDINGTPVYDNEGNFIAGILCCRDITEKIKNDNHIFIDKQYDILNRIIEELDLTVLRLSYPDLKLIDMNKKAYNFIKSENPAIDSIGSIKGINYKDVVDSFDKVYILKHIKDVIDRNETSYSKYRKFTISGEEKFINVIYQPIIGINNEILEIVAIGIDVTEEVKANREMKKSLKVQEEIFGNISHEMRTPLNVIFSAVQLFELYSKNEALYINKNKNNVDRNIHTIKKNCYRLSRTINNMLDLSKIKLGYFEVNLFNGNIVTMIKDIVKGVSEYFTDKEASIVFNTNIDEKIIAYDANNFCRVILNLISNAIKFSEDSVDISIEVRDKNDFVEIYVEDKGIGIEKSHLQDIFEKFKQVDKSFTRTSEGSGLGLYIAKSIVELHNGNISVKSELGEGSIFKIVLPVRLTKIDINRNNCFDREMINMEFSDIYS